jgi:CHRD domain
MNREPAAPYSPPEVGLSADVTNIGEKKMKGPQRLISTLLVLGMTVAAVAHDSSSGTRLSAKLKPTNEVPALSSTASGRFKAVLDTTNQTISYELSYSDLEGSVLQAHIHIGQPGVNGGISVFLCGNPPTVPAATVPQPPACAPSPATVIGVITADHIIGPNAQGVAPTAAGVNEFAELAKMIRERATYVNVHSSKFPGGEVRGAVKVSNGRGDHDDD